MTPKKKVTEADDEPAERKLPSLYEEIAAAGEDRPLNEALVRRWAREVAGFVVRKKPLEYGNLAHNPLLPIGAGTRYAVFLRENTADKFLDGVTLEELAVYLTGYLREGCY